MAVSGTGGGGGKSIEAGKAHVSFSAQDAGLESYLSKIGGKVSKFGSTLTGIGGGLMGMGAAVLAPLAGLFTEAVSHFDSVNDAADRLGTATEAISRLGYAADLAGSNMADVEASARFMQKALVKTPESFAKLGLSAEEFKGMDLEEQFLAIAGAIEDLDDAARGPALQSVLGKGGTKLGPMLKDGAAALNAALKEADLVGDTVGGLDASRAAKTADAFDKSWKSVKNTLRAVGAAFLPLADSIDGAIGPFLNATAGIRQFIGANRAAIQTVAAVAAAVFVAGAAITGLGVAIQAAGFIISGLAMLFSPFAIITAGITAAAAALLYFSKVATGAGGVASMLGEMGETFKTTFAGVKDALEAGDWEAAWEIMLAGLTLAWEQFILGLRRSMQSLWDDFKKGMDTFQSDWDLVRTKKNWLEAAWISVFGEPAISKNKNTRVESGPLERKAADAGAEAGAAAGTAAGTAAAAAVGDFWLTERAKGPEEAWQTMRPIGGMTPGAPVVPDVDKMKSEMSQRDKDLKKAADDHTQAQQDIARNSQEAAKRLDELGQADIQKKKDALAASRAKAAEAAKEAAFWKDFLADVSYGKWAAEAGAAAQAAASIGAAGTFRTQFAAASAAAGSDALGKIEKNTSKTNELLDDIKNEVGGLEVE